MEEFVKEVLYAYPLLKTVEKDYAEHIQNQAVLSYKSNLSTERLAEYIAEEIVESQRLAWLKRVVCEVLDKLDDLEKTMVSIRYFGKKRKDSLSAPFGKWSERTYFREQERLGKKIGGMLTESGLTAGLFALWFAPTQLFETVHKYAKKRTDEVSVREKRFLEDD